jgi:hypothetical protein
MWNVLERGAPESYGSRLSGNDVIFGREFT